MVSVWGVVFPWVCIFEDSLKGVLRGNGNGNVQREGDLCVGMLSCVVVSDGSFYVSYVGDLFIVANSVEPLWCSEVTNFCDPNFFAKRPNGCVEGGMPGRKKKVFVAVVDGAADDEV